MKRLLVLVPLLALLSHSQAKDLPAPVAEEPPRYRPSFLPFENGEYALYEGRWNNIPVATAEVWTAPLMLNGQKAFQVDVRARTLRVLDLVWKMRDSAHSVFDAATLAPKKFIFQQRENSRSTDTHALFDPGAKKWTVARQRGKKVSRYEIDSANALDPITATYLLRSVDFKVGDELRFHVFGGKSLYLLTVEVAGRETVTTRAGTFDAYRIIPRTRNLSEDGYSDRMREAVVWISADAQRLPVKIQSRVFVGSVSIELTRNQAPLHSASVQSPSS